MAWSWTARYRSYERRCLKADKLPEGRKRAAAFGRLSKSYERLRAELPRAISTGAGERTAFDEAKEDLLVARLFSRCSQSDRRLLRLWLDKDCTSPPPPIDDANLSKLIHVVIWARDHAAAQINRTPEAENKRNADDNVDDTSTVDSERNKWLYEQRSAGVTLPKLKSALSAKCNESDWYPLDSESGIRSAIYRHAFDNGLTPPRGRPGRPRKPAKP